MPVGAAIAGAGILGAGASIYSANKAAGAQTSAADKATAAQQQMFGITQKNLSPYVANGADAMSSLTRLLSPNGGVNMAELEKLPGYQFDLTQGEKAVQNSASARGLGTSGAAMKGASSYATGLADKYFGEQYNRLLGTAQLGENAGAGVGTAATATGSQIGSNIIGAGNAQAGAAMAGGNAIAGLGGTAMNAYMASKLFGPGGMYGAPAGAPNGVGVGTYDPGAGIVG